MMEPTLQWFILSVTTLALSTVVSASNVLFVKPTNGTLCPQQPCHTLEYYAQRWQSYLTSNTVVQFLPGEHVLGRDWNELLVENVFNLTLIGSDSMNFGSSPLGIPLATSRISCKRRISFFMFSNVTGLFIARLAFSECGGGKHNLKSTLYFYEVSNLVVDSVTIQNSTGTGLRGYNIFGKSSIHRSAFLFNAATCNGNINLGYEYCSETFESSVIMNITSSWILFGNSTAGGYGCVGGLNVWFIQSCYSVKVHVHNTTMKGNVGGNMGLLFNDATKKNVIISNSHFKGGYTLHSGAGILTLAYNTSQCVQSNLLNIMDSEFVGNYADTDGGAVMVVSHFNPCTMVYINGSKFYNNTAQKSGGHIALALNPESNSNIHIIVNNSHFKDGRADSGGGLSVWSFDSSYCISESSSNIHNYQMYIFNSEFYQNVASANGGLDIDLTKTCFAIHIVVDNVLFSRNAATLYYGGNIGILQMCAVGNSVTLSRSIVEFGNASGAGGGMAFITRACTFPIVSYKPTTVNIAESTFQYNTANKQGGGLAVMLNSFKLSCCSAKVNVVDVTFLNNSAASTGGNIRIVDDGGQWLNNTVRIENSLIEGGMAAFGGGIYLLQHLNSTGSNWKKKVMFPTVEVLFISNTQFVHNQVFTVDGGASLRVYIVSPDLAPITPVMTKRFTIINTKFDGTYSDSSNVQFMGTSGYSPHVLMIYDVLFMNVSFQGFRNTLLSQQLGRFGPSNFVALIPKAKQPAAGVRLSFISDVTFIDCDFIESCANSALTVESTNIFFEGNINFRNNTAMYGGGLLLVDNSIMYLRPNTHITFSHNHATSGGAIFVKSDAIFAKSDAISSSRRCFYQIDPVNDVYPVKLDKPTKFDPKVMKIQITFENNTANIAGSALYGGDVDFCRLTLVGESSNYFDSIFMVQNTDDDPTAISSDPYKVCHCNGSKPECGSQHLEDLWSIYTYPGALIQVKAVVVGQKNGIVPGDVHAYYNTSVLLGDLQGSQSTGSSCTSLNYTVFSSHTVEYITLITEPLPNQVNLPVSGLELKVILLPCPWGFTLTKSPPTKCDCEDELKKHHIHTCNITAQTITRPIPLWIGYYHPGNESFHSAEGVLVHDHCPFDYCKPEDLSIQLNDSDQQCAFSRSGILCGACQPGLSLALGTSRCLECSNKYLMLLLAFAVAGCALVVLLTYTNMTVTEGAINGLIFYANIIHINRAIFFPTESTGMIKHLLHVLLTFIAWVNLDLGIETCFYSGMDMYSKAWLQFLFPIYVWAIVGGMIFSSHYSTTAAKLFRRHAVKVLATLLLLSFAKLQRTIIMALSFTFLTYPDGSKKTLWLYDSNIEYLRGKHIPLFSVALLALLFLLIPYTLVLLLIQCLSKLNHRIFIWVRKLKPLLDAYTGPYKDRYRFWTGLLLVVRTILFLIFTLGNPGLNLAAISVTSICLAFTPRVHKKVLLTLLEYSFLLNLSAVSAATFYSRYTQFNGNQVVVVCISVGTALLTFVGILVYHLYKCATNSLAWKYISDQFVCRRQQFPLNDRELVSIAAEGSDEEEEEPTQAEIQPLILYFDEYREPVLGYEDQD